MISPGTAASRWLRVEDPGPLTTVQDRGRPGWAHLGVPRAGALDGPAAALANRLVGNDPAAAVLETTVGGVTFTTGAAMTLAVTGAPAAVEVRRRAVAFGAPVTVPGGAIVRVGPAETGVRSYVAVAGGLDVPAVLGSRSTDTLAWVGPARLRAGDRLPVGAPTGPPAAVEEAVVRRGQAPALLPVMPGPRIDWFTDGALETLTGSAYLVGGESNRVGLRLEGPRLDRGPGTRDVELPSEGMVLGAVQVPASGEPVVFLNDHPTTGGYPVLAVVAAEALFRCAQLRPGDLVRFARR